MGRSKVNLKGMYSKAIEMSETELEIARLQTEVEQLRTRPNSELESQIQELRQQLEASTGVREIEVNQIRPNPEQPRHTFSQNSIEGMAQSLRAHGQLQPIIVMTAKEGLGFDLFDGERRWRAAQLINWATLKAVTMPRPQDLHRKALLTTLHREDLNPLDKAEALLKEITAQTGIASDQALKILATVVRRLEYQKRMKQISKLVTCTAVEQEQQLTKQELNQGETSILLVLLGLGLNPASVVANDLRMLSLFEDLQQAIRAGNLKASQALTLQRLSAKKLNLSEVKAQNIRSQATTSVIEQELSLAQTKTLVGELISQYAPKKKAVKPATAVPTILQNLQTLSLKELDKSQLEELRQELLAKLTEIEHSLTNE